MLRYVATATAARAFSLSPRTRRAYRVLGNALLCRQRGLEGLPARYVERARFLLESCRRHDALHDGERVLEIGTGWMHWESTILLLFYDVEATLFDVVDNRLWDVFQLYMRQLEPLLDERLDPDSSRRERAGRLLRRIREAAGFEDVYALLGARYVLEPSGSLDALPSSSFALIASCDTLEHVDRQALPAEVRAFARLLVPGGHAIHEIDLADHLAYFDRRADPKQYYRYSRATWDRWFESAVQHFNRVQRSEWLHLFEEARLACVSEEVDRHPIDHSVVHDDWRHLGEDDLTALRLRLVSRRD